MEAWEKVALEKDIYTARSTSRLKVPGGWLYRVEVDTVVSDQHRQYAIALQFAPDENPKKIMVKRRTT